MQYPIAAAAALHQYIEKQFVLVQVTEVNKFCAGNVVVKGHH